MLGMLALLFFGSAILAGIALARRLWARTAHDDDGSGPCERAASAGLLAFAIVIAIDWALSFAHLLTRPALIVASFALLALAARHLRPCPREPRARSPRERILVALALVPLIGWTAYVTWRGAVVFPQTSDALSYHLPKALFIARNHALAIFDGPDARLSTFPANYEMLLADVLVLTRSDGLVAIVGPLSYGLFGLTVAAMAERWWGRGALPVVTAVLLSLGMPTVMLASGTQKNDLLACAAMMAALHWGARWAARGERVAWALGTVAFMLAIGTKVYAGVLVLSLTPCALWRARALRASRASERSRPWPVTLASLSAATLVGFFLLGGEAYALNLVTIGHPVGHVDGNGYGRWHQLWEFPAVQFLRGLSWTEYVWVPWRHQFWLCPQYDAFFSSYGPAASLLLLTLPFAVARYRALGRRHERNLVTLGLLLAFFVTLPVRVPDRPYGIFVGFVRYTPYAAVAIFLWTVVPFVKTREASRVGRATVVSALVASSALFAWFAFGCVTDDVSLPFDFVRIVAGGYRPRRMVRSWTTRAASYIDREAGPDDVIAFDGGFDSWVYPAFGKELRRQVVFLHPDRGPVVVPPNVKWVGVDGSWNCIFGAMPDLSQWFEEFGKGAPLPAELVVYDQLKADPHFRLVYEEKKANQAVFERIE